MILRSDFNFFYVSGVSILDQGSLCNKTILILMGFSEIMMNGDRFN